MGYDVPQGNDRDKYLEVLQFLLRDEQYGGANNQRLGKVKLMKLLYFADFDHFQNHGRSITGDVYRKKDFGPVPDMAESMLYEMTRQERLTVQKEFSGPYQRHVYTVVKPFEPFRHLDDAEMATLKDVVQRWKDHSLQSIVLASHGDPPWKMVGYYEEIPYELVYYRDDVIRPEMDVEPDDGVITKAVNRPGFDGGIHR